MDVGYRAESIHGSIEGISGFISYDTLAGAPETPTRKLGKL